MAIFRKQELRRNVILNKCREDTNAVCSICWGNLGEDLRQSHAVTTCGHVFHPGCFEAWTGSCPNCRSDFHILPTISDELRQLFGEDVQNKGGLRSVFLRIFNTAARKVWAGLQMFFPDS